MDGKLQDLDEHSGSGRHDGASSTGLGKRAALEATEGQPASSRQRAAAAAEAEVRRPAGQVPHGWEDARPLRKDELKIGMEVFMDGSNSGVEAGLVKLVNLGPPPAKKGKKGAVHVEVDKRRGTRRWVLPNTLFDSAQHPRERQEGKRTAEKSDIETSDSSPDPAKRRRAATSPPGTELCSASIEERTEESAATPFRTETEQSIALDIPLLSLSDTTLRLTIEGSANARRKMIDSVRKLTRTREMLMVCLVDLVPRMLQVYEMCHVPSAKAMVYAQTLKWARENFESAVRNDVALSQLKGSRVRSMTAENTANWYDAETLEKWGQYVESLDSESTALREASDMYSIARSTNVTAEANARKRQKEYTSRKNIRRTAMRQHNRAILRVWSSTQAIVSANVNFASRAAYDRDRLSTFRRVAGKARRIRSCGGMDEVGRRRCGRVTSRARTRRW